MVNFVPPVWYRMLGQLARAVAGAVGSRRLGPWTPATAPTAWLHAASVGEAKGLLALLRFLPPDLPLTLTATTSDGLERLSRSGHPVFLLPLDHSPVVDRFLQARRVAVAVFLESEAWPIALSRLQRGRVPVAFAAFRSSRSSLGRWRRFTRLFPGWTSTAATVWTDSVTFVGGVERLGFSTVHAGTSLKWAGHPPTPFVSKEPPLAAAVSFHLRDFPTVVRLTHDHPREGWLWFPRRPHRLRLHRLLARWAGLRTVQGVPGPGEVRISETFGETSLWLPRARFCWVAPGHDAEEAHRLGVPQTWTGRPPRPWLRAGSPADQVAFRIAEWIQERMRQSTAYYNGLGQAEKVDTIGSDL